jgi:hypothetical protein
MRNILSIINRIFGSVFIIFDLLAAG